MTTCVGRLPLGPPAAWSPLTTNSLPSTRFQQPWMMLGRVSAGLVRTPASPSRAAIGGDSAGGNLAAVTAIRARDAGVPLALQVLVYPVTDAQLESDSYAVHASGLNLTLEKMRWYWDQYLDGADPLDAQASPIMASDLSALAPALVQLAEYDPLCSEGQIYGQRLADAGVEATVTLYEGTIHGFLRMPALTGSADDALAQIAAALRSSGIRGVRSDGSLAV
jgi:acetyl esterase